MRIGADRTTIFILKHSGGVDGVVERSGEGRDAIS
jgi:hypothetical protein